MSFKAQNETRLVAEREQILSTKPFVVERVGYRNPAGTLISRFVVTHPGAVVMIPVDKDSKIVLVKQYRWATEQFLLELPAGTREVGEEPLATAKRELAEEIGSAASEWHLLGEVFPAPGFCSEKQFIYLARGLSEVVAQGDEDEEIEVVRLSLSEIERLIVSNVIKDSKTISALMMAKLRGFL